MNVFKHIVPFINGKVTVTVTITNNAGEKTVSKTVLTDGK